MKKIFLVVVFTAAASSLTALSASDFIVLPESMFFGYFSTWDEFVKVTNREAEVKMMKVRETTQSSRVDFQQSWIRENTRLEDDLVKKAFQEIPENTKIGSAYYIALNCIMSSPFIAYYVFIYTDSDGKRYYRLLRIILYFK